MPFRRTNRMQKDLYVSDKVDALSLTWLPSELVSFDANLESPFPLPLPVNRTGDSLITEALTSSGS
jgi:hypothetical protein